MNMSLKKLIAISSLILAGFTFASAVYAQQKIIPAQSTIAFTSKQMGVPVIGDADTVKELRKPTWFDLGKFPTASFQSTSAKALGGGKFEVAGNLTIKGKSKPIAAVVQLAQKGDATTVEGNFAMKRLDFSIGDGEWKDVSIVADEVVVKIKLALSGVAAL
jgi:polyisoprenoid-binding protein YceI